MVARIFISLSGVSTVFLTCVVVALPLSSQFSSNLVNSTTKLCQNKEKLLCRFIALAFSVGLTVWPVTRNICNGIMFSKWDGTAFGSFAFSFSLNFGPDCNDLISSTLWPNRGLLMSWNFWPDCNGWVFLIFWPNLDLSMSLTFWLD